MIRNALDRQASVGPTAIFSELSIERNVCGIPVHQPPADGDVEGFNPPEYDTAASVEERWRRRKEATHHGSSFRFGMATWKKNICIAILSISVGLGVGGCAVLVDFLAYRIFRRNMIDLSLSAPSYVNVVLCGLIAAVSALCCAMLIFFGRPLSSGSGLSLVKVYLNGSCVAGAMSAKTLLCRALGSILAAGLIPPASWEDCSIHIGAAIGAGLTRGKWMLSMRFASLYRWLHYRLGDMVHREFVLIGAAAGLGAAFRAPMAATIFAFEEAGSFWNASLTARCFTASLIASMCMQAYYGAFGTPFQLGGNRWNVSFAQLPLWLIVGALGGVFAGLISWVDDCFIRFRGGRSFLWRIVESIMWCGGVVVCFSTAALGTSFVECLPGSVVKSVVPPGACAIEGQAPMGVLLFLSNPASALAALLGSSQGVIPLSLLGTLCGLYAVGMMCMASLPLSRSFTISHIVTGASMGRLIGEGLYLSGLCSVDAPSQYALVGAAGMLSACWHSRVAVVVMLVELTQAVNAIPIVMAAVLGGKYVAYTAFSLLNVSEMANKFGAEYALLGRFYLHKLPSPMLEFMCAEHAVSREPVCLTKTCTRSRLLEILRQTSHHCFPVIDSDGVLQGAAERVKLRALLMETDSNCAADLDPALDIMSVARLRPQFVISGSPLVRAYRVFRELGLRHLFVIQRTGKVVGVLTRRDLAGASSASVLERFGRGQPTADLQGDSKESECPTEDEGEVSLEEWTVDGADADTIKVQLSEKED